MSKIDDFNLALWKEAGEVAMRFVQDAGYEHCRIVPRHTLPDAAAELKSSAHGKARNEASGKSNDQAIYFYFEARKGPNATRKMPVEYLLVRVRITGPAHKTLRPSFVTPPLESLP